MKTIVLVSFDRPHSKYAWDRIIEQRLPGMYPDLNVSLFKSRNKIAFECSFRNRSTSEADIRRRFYNFMSLYPMLKVSNLQIVGCVLQ